MPLFALTDAEYGWGNELWSADEDYLTNLTSEADNASGSIVECGSGLSTLLLALIARRTGAKLHSLEHNAQWHQRVVATLAAFGLNDNIVHYAPLQSYGEFDWYQMPSSFPTDVSLVVCDGPPGETRGGRYGALPVLGPNLASPCKILLDDASRTAEMAILARWAVEFGTATERTDRTCGYASVTVTAFRQGPTN